MRALSRRNFLNASITGLAAGAFAACDRPFGAAAAKTRDEPAFRPNTLFLTWQRDPTTTITVQWVGVTGETADPTISYAP
ncbi:MAG TPA: metallophosphoesterase, partial [Gemmataceae bacterium]|nr:metallophosphoesterase [Gemmataceae bacterium]